MAKIRITDLHLRTIIGANDWERDVKQDVLFNIELVYDSSQAAQTDNLSDSVDYKTITKKIIKEVEASDYQLIEKLADHVLTIALEHPKVESATVRLDKPGALRFAKSVSIEITKKKSS